MRRHGDKKTAKKRVRRPIFFAARETIFGVRPVRSRPINLLTVPLRFRTQNATTRPLLFVTRRIRSYGHLIVSFLFVSNWRHLTSAPHPVSNCGSCLQTFRVNLETEWRRCNRLRLSQCRTFYVLFGNNQQPSNLILDWDNGFTLYDNWTNSNVWTYKFSELRGSSDDHISRLKLHFNDNGRIETKVRACIIRPREDPPNRRTRVSGRRGGRRSRTREPSRVPNSGGARDVRYTNAACSLRIPPSSTNRRESYTFGSASSVRRLNSLSTNGISHSGSVSEFHSTEPTVHLRRTFRDPRAAAYGKQNESNVRNTRQ